MSDVEVVVEAADATEAAAECASTTGASSCSSPACQLPGNGWVIPQQANSPTVPCRPWSVGRARGSVRYSSGQALEVARSDHRLQAQCHLACRLTCSFARALRVSSRLV